MSDRFVPGTPVLIEVDAGRLPKVELGSMRARFVAARNERSALLLDLCQRPDNVLRPLYARRIALRPYEDKVIVHHRKTFHAEPVGDKFQFLRLGVHKDHIGIAPPAGVEGLAGPLRHDLYLDPGLRFEQRQDVAEEARVLRRGCRRHDD